MPIELVHSQPTLLLRRAAFEQHGLTRTFFDERLGLTSDEFRVEGDLVVVGPIHAEGALGDIVTELEDLGLVYFDDFFDLSGNWPDWLKVYAMAARPAGGGARLHPPPL
jgi:hypothetical protein